MSKCKWTVSALAFSMVLTAAALVFGMVAKASATAGPMAVHSATIATGTIIPVWPNLPVPPRLRGDKIVYLLKKPFQLGKTVFPPVRWPTLKVYPAPKNISNGCAVISCPGGGYGSIAVHWEGTRLAKWLNGLGVSCFVLTYRLPDGKLPPSGVPWPLQDVRRAVQILRANAKKWHINPHKIGVAGFSAGGSVASLAGVHWLPGNPNAVDPLNRFSTRPDFLILGYPVISMMPAITNVGTRNNLLGTNPPLDVAEYLSGELNVTPLTPPAFICYAHNDNVVSHQNEILFYKALKRNKVPAELRVYKLGGHGFIQPGYKRTVKEWHLACQHWLARMHFLSGK